MKLATALEKQKHSLQDNVCMQTADMHKLLQTSCISEVHLITNAMATSDAFMPAEYKAQPVSIFSSSCLQWHLMAPCRCLTITPDVRPILHLLSVMLEALSGGLQIVQLLQYNCSIQQCSDQLRTCFVGCACRCI